MTFPTTLPFDFAFTAFALAIFFLFEKGPAMKMYARDMFLWMCVFSTFAAYSVSGSQQWVEYLFAGQLAITLIITILDFIIPFFNFMAAVMLKKKWKHGTEMGGGNAR